MKLTSKQINKLAEKLTLSSLKQVMKEQLDSSPEMSGPKGRSRDELALAYSLLTRNIDPANFDMDLEHSKVVPLLMSTSYEDEIDIESLDPEIRKQLDDVVFEYGTLYDDDIVWDAKELAKKKSGEQGISFGGLDEGCDEKLEEQIEPETDGKLAWLFRFRAENGLSNEELLEDIAEICQGNETVWKYLVRGLKNKYGYKVG